MVATLCIIVFHLSDLLTHCASITFEGTWRRTGVGHLHDLLDLSACICGDCSEMLPIGVAFSGNFLLSTVSVHLSGASVRVTGNFQHCAFLAKPLTWALQSTANVAPTNGALHLGKAKKNTKGKDLENAGGHTMSSRILLCSEPVHARHRVQFLCPQQVACN